MVGLPRRIVLIGAAAAPLASCGKADDTPAHPAAPAGKTLTPAADVGKAKVVDGVLITQPSPGEFKGFVALCTHRGCAVAVKNGDIECPCHGSKFNLDGTVAHGPATEPLAARPVTVRDGQIVTT
jgi:Rieske Fe-S protein